MLSRGKIADPKWRFFWEFCDEGQEDGLTQIIPRAFAGQWKRVCNGWGRQGLAVSRATMRALAQAYGVDPEAFVACMNNARHLVAPTAIDLTKLEPGATIAYPHLDFNFGSLHDKANAQGLNIWDREGNCWRVANLPKGAYVFQAGLQLEMMTGGLVEAG